MGVVCGLREGGVEWIGLDQRGVWALDCQVLVGVVGRRRAQNLGQCERVSWQGPGERFALVCTATVRVPGAQLTVRCSIMYFHSRSSSYRVM